MHKHFGLPRKFIRFECEEDFERWLYALKPKEVFLNRLNVMTATGRVIDVQYVVVPDSDHEATQEH